jgi:hypothetical protein
MLRYFSRAVVRPVAVPAGDEVAVDDDIDTTLVEGAAAEARRRASMGCEGRNAVAEAASRASARARLPFFAMRGARCG